MNIEAILSGVTLIGLAYGFQYHGGGHDYSKDVLSPFRVAVFGVILVIGGLTRLL